MTSEPEYALGGWEWVPGTSERHPRPGSIPAHRIRCEATTKRGDQCRMTPYLETDEDGIRVCYVHSTKESIAAIRESRWCPDCGGWGTGCCINADIPLPGVER